MLLSGLADASVSTPLDTCEKLMPNRGLAVSQLEYSRVIGCLMYAMTCTRPDIAFAVGKLSRYTSNPGTQHWQAIQRASKKQTCITGSTMEYEFVALAAADKEAEWLKNLLFEIPLWVKPMAPISIRCDSVATLAKAYSQMYNGKSRHLGVRHSMIRELITNGTVSIEFVRSQQNLAGHLTKGLARDLVIKYSNGLKGSILRTLDSRIFERYLINSSNGCEDSFLEWGTGREEVDLTKEFLSSMFSVKDMGEGEVWLSGPDIAFAVGKLSRYTSNPGTQHWARPRFQEGTDAGIASWCGGAICLGFLDAARPCITGFYNGLSLSGLVAQGSRCAATLAKAYTQSSRWEVPQAPSYTLNDHDSVVKVTEVVAVVEEGTMAAVVVVELETIAAVVVEMIASINITKY
ncbi:hypothetical protein Tco_0445540 [Tanacetum coccineum]